MSKRALVTGAAGQDGILLSHLLCAQGYRVFAVAREDNPRVKRLQALVPNASIVYADIRDSDSMATVLRDVKPDEVYNLAAFSSVARSWAHAREVMEVNSLAVVCLLDAIRKLEDSLGSQIRFYQASSSEMFGQPAVSPQDERTAFHPRSPYGVSKSAAHLLTLNYRESYGMFACSGILYNHESPLREPHFVTRKITKGVAAIANGAARRLSLGRLDVSRDWGWAPDYVRAMWLMLQQEEPDDYVVATGKSHTLADFLAAAFASIGVEDWSDRVESDESLFRPAEVVGLVGDSSKARARLDWAPTVGFQEIVQRMVEHDLKLAAGSVSELDCGW